MPNDFDHYNDGSRNPPRLRVQHSLWSLLKLPMNAPEEWSLPEKCRRVKEAGFAGIECWLDESSEQHHCPGPASRRRTQHVLELVVHDWARHARRLPRHGRVGQWVVLAQFGLD